MLSELQLKAHSLLFLRDLFPRAYDDETNITNPTDASSTSSSISNASADDAQHAVHATRKLGLPPFIILYLLWRPDSDHFDSPRLYAKHVIQPAIQQILSLQTTSEGSENSNTDSSSSLSLFPIYLAVDRLAPPDKSMNADQMDAYRKEQINLTEQLIRVVASGNGSGNNHSHNMNTDATSQEQQQENQASTTEAQLRTHIDGMVVGLSSDFRAAPALETCMDAILVGDAERRTFSNSNRTSRKAKRLPIIIRNGRELEATRSCIGIVTEYPDDLTGLDPVGETDAVQNLCLHTRSVGNWAGKGNVLNFAARSQK